jgi:hypothetical protein
MRPPSIIPEVPTMSRTWIVAAILSLAIPLAGAAQSSAQVAAVPSTTPLHDSQSATTPAQYAQLAAYFHQQEARYRAQATAERIERDRRAHINAGLMQKYPRPVDSAQYLYESYLSRADSAALQARRYDQLAGDSTDSTF